MAHRAETVPQRTLCGKQAFRFASWSTVISRVMLVLGSVAVGISACAQPPITQSLPRPANHRTPEGKLINRWWEARRAAGNVGDWYDNRDRGHSKLNIGTNHPQMKQVSYPKEEIARRADWAVQRKLLPFVTLGNSSTSAPPNRGGSNPRHYYVVPQGVAFLYAQYRANNLYVYPEHRDYDPGHDGRTGYGDLYPTNTPYLVISQGSSGSDRAFLQAFAYTMAAFRPKVKETLIDKKLLMPTLQYILRRCYKEVHDPADYLSGKAHPPVFDGKKLDSMRMIHLAQNMTVDTIPPIVQLEVLGEDFTAEQGAQRSEKLADTPVVIARIHRSREFEKHIVVSAKRSADINKKDLDYHWVILRGDTDRIRVKLSDGGATAELTISYHDRRPISPGSVMQSNRVDIGVFVHNGSSYSAPGFVTVCYLDSEARTYDQNGRLLDVYRAAGDTRIGYDTSSATQLFGSRYDISDWPALFSLLGKDAAGLGSDLLRKQLTSDQLVAVARVAEVFRPEYSATLTVKGKLSKQQRAEQRRIQEALAKALTAADPAIGASVKAVLERALNAIRANLNLYFDNTAVIDALADACSDKKGKANFLMAREKLAAIGIAKAGKLRSAVPGATTLTKYEVYQVERMNLAIMSHLLFPAFLRRGEVKNFVDQRLEVPHPWHDVYRYDDAGKLVGWTRFEDGQPGRYVVKEEH